MTIQQWRECCGIIRRSLKFDETDGRWQDVACKKGVKNIFSQADFSRGMAIHNGNTEELPVPPHKLIPLQLEVAYSEGALPCLHV